MAVKLQLLEYLSAQITDDKACPSGRVESTAKSASVDCNVGTQNTHSQVDLSGVDDDLVVVS